MANYETIILPKRNILAGSPPSHLLQTVNSIFTYPSSSINTWPINGVVFKQN
jgi:hypothetical protein